MVMLADTTSPLALLQRRTSLAGTLVQPPAVTPTPAPKPAIGPTVAPTALPTPPPPTATPSTAPKPAQPPPTVSLPVPPPVGPSQTLLDSRSNPYGPPGTMAPAGPNVGPTVPPVPGDAQPPIDFITPFSPGDDLRFQQINPVDNARLTGVQGQVGGAASRLSSAPDLTAAAQEKLRLFEEQSNPAFQRALQEVGRRAAAQGTLGAGMTTSNLGDVLSERERYLSEARRGLASDTAFAQGGENRANLSSLSGLESQLYGQGQGARQELRGERGYQADTAQTALNNRIQQRMLEESLLQGQFGRQATAAGLGLQGAEQYGQQAADGSQTASDLLQELAYQESLKRLYPAGRPRPRGTDSGTPAPDLPG